MAKWRFELQETFYHTYEVEIPDDVTEDEVDDYFYNMDADEQKAGLVNSESFTWEITETVKV